MRRHHRLRGDTGASLIIALAFITCLGVLSIAVLGLASGSLQGTRAQRDETDQLYSADAGFEYGVQNVKADTTKCATSGSTASWTIPGQVNLANVAYSCSWVSGGTTTTGGGSSLLGGYSIILGTDGLSIQGNTNGAPSTIARGNIYSGGPISVPAATPLQVEGDLELAATCPPLPANVTVTAGNACVGPKAAPAVTAPTVVVPSGSPATTLNPATALNGATCTIFYPGKYTTVPGFSSTQHYYFASGTYYFQGTGSVNFTGDIFGGAPGTVAPDTNQITAKTACATDAIADTKSTDYACPCGTGVTFLLGGNAVLRPQSGTSLELYKRVPVSGNADFAATPGVGIWASTTAQTNYSPVSNGSTVIAGQDKDSPIVIHGLTYLPNANISIREPLNAGTAGAPSSFFLGGLLAQGLIIDMTGNGSSGVTAAISGSSTSTVAAARKVTVTSTATAVKDGAVTTITATVDLPLSAGTPVISNWRKTG